MKIIVDSPGFFILSCISTVFFLFMAPFHIYEYQERPIQNITYLFIISILSPTLLWFSSTITVFETELIVRSGFFGQGKKNTIFINNIEEIIYKTDHLGRVRHFRIKTFSGDGMEFVRQQRNFGAAFSFLRDTLSKPVRLYGK